MPSGKLYHTDYYITNREKILNYSKSYRLANKQYFTDYYLKNKDRLNYYARNYYKINLKRCRKNNILWKQNNIPGYGTFRQKPFPLKKINKQVIITFD